MGFPPLARAWASRVCASREMGCRVQWVVGYNGLFWLALGAGGVLWDGFDSDLVMIGDGDVVMVWDGCGS